MYRSVVVRLSTVVSTPQRYEAGHFVPRVLGPLLAPRTATAIDLAIGDTEHGAIFVGAAGQRLDRCAAPRRRERPGEGGRDRQADLAGRRSPTARGAKRRSHADPRTTMRYDRARQSLDRHTTYIVAAFVAGAAR